jgi:hypothetical protein
MLAVIYNSFITSKYIIHHGEVQFLNFKIILMDQKQYNRGLQRW